MFSGIARPKVPPMRNLPNNALKHDAKGPGAFGAA